MAITPEQQDHLVILAQFAERIVKERDDAFVRNYEWNGVPTFSTDITQQELDDFTAANPNSPLANAKVADIVEVEYVSSQLLALLDDKFSHLYAVRKFAR